jgi:hypothetical protein
MQVCHSKGEFRLIDLPINQVWVEFSEDGSERKRLQIITTFNGHYQEYLLTAADIEKIINEWNRAETEGEYIEIRNREAESINTESQQ